MRQVRNLLRIFPLFIFPATVFTQNVGIGTTTPAARLHVTDSSVLFSSAGDVPAAAGRIPISGAGRRMMWYPDKAAFRVGYVNSTQWDKDSIGISSFGAGTNVIAKGRDAIALGNGSKALGQGSFSAGTSNISSGFFSFSLGSFTEAYGELSVAMGYAATAMGSESISIGSHTIAYGTSVGIGSYAAANNHNSVAIGANVQANDYKSLAMGFDSRAEVQGAIVIGNSIVGRSINSTVIGIYNDTTANNSLFEIGNGSNATNRKNAITVLKNGRTGIGTINPRSRLHVADSSVLFSAIGNVPGTPADVPISGAGRRMMWYADKAAFRAGYDGSTNWDKDSIGNYSVAMGMNARAKGNSSLALGNNVKASVANSVAIGINSEASGQKSFALGTGLTAAGDESFLIGISNHTSEPESFIIGKLSDAYAPFAYIFGSYNTAHVNSSYIIGSGNDSRAAFSTIIGSSLISKSAGSIVIGNYNDTTLQNTVFEVGMGTANFFRRNAITTFSNGSTHFYKSIEVGSKATPLENIQKGVIVLGECTNTNGLCSFTVAFPEAYTTAPTFVLATPLTETGQSFNDVFAVTVRNITTTGFVVNVKRVDATSYWAQDLRLSWMAMQ